MGTAPETDQTNGVTPRPATEATGGQAAARWLLALIVLGLAWRITRYALCFPFWGDEAYLDINFLRRGFVELLQPLEYAQIAPLLYLWLQKAVCLVAGGGEYALRASSLAAGIGALLLFWRLARRALPAQPALMAIGIFAASYSLVRHTCESKPYACDLCVAMMLVWAGGRWLEHVGSAKWASVTLLAAIVGIWLSYPAVFVVGGVGLAMLIRLIGRSDARGWAWWIAYAVLTGVSFGAFFLVFGRTQAQSVAGGWLEEYWRESFPPESGGLWAVLRWLGEVHTGRMLGYPMGGPHYASSLTTVLCLIGLVRLLRMRRFAFVALLVGPAALALVAAVLHRYPYGGSVRVAIFLAPAICVLTGSGIDTVLERIKKGATRQHMAAAVCAVLALLCIGGLVRDVLQPYKAEEDAAARRVMREVAREIGSEAVAIVNPPYGTHGPPDGPKFHQSLRYYLRLYSGREPIWWQPQAEPEAAPWVLAYSGPDFGPTRARVEERARAAKVSIENERTFPLSVRDGSALRLFACSALK